MHFGYYNYSKTNFLKRDTMLNEMNTQVYNRLCKDTTSDTLVDLGYGLGATMHHFLSLNSKINMIGLTLSEFQVIKGNRILADIKGVILKKDYRSTSLSSNSMSGALAIESFCHCGHNAKALREAYRILKKGTKLVIADAFLKKPSVQLKGLSAYSYQKLCKNWSLSYLSSIKTIEHHLNTIGFHKIHIEEISCKVAPSLFHVPFTTVGFILKQFIDGKTIKKESLDNLTASIFSLIAGLHLNDFGYYIISAEK